MMKSPIGMFQCFCMAWAVALGVLILTSVSFVLFTGLHENFQWILGTLAGVTLLGCSIYGITLWINGV